MRRYRSTTGRDPYWLTLKYPHTAPDGTTYPRGTQAWYWPNSKRMQFGSEAQEAPAKFAAEREDEAAYSSGYGV